MRAHAHPVRAASRGRPHTARTEPVPPRVYGLWLEELVHRHRADGVTQMDFEPDEGFDAWQRRRTREHGAA